MIFPSNANCQALDARQYDLGTRVKYSNMRSEPINVIQCYSMLESDFEPNAIFPELFKVARPEPGPMTLNSSGKMMEHGALYLGQNQSWFHLGRPRHLFENKNVLGLMADGLASNQDCTRQTDSQSR